MQTRKEKRGEFVQKLFLALILLCAGGCRTTASSSSETNSASNGLLGRGETLGVILTRDNHVTMVSCLSWSSYQDAMVRSAAGALQSVASFTETDLQCRPVMVARNRSSEGGQPSLCWMSIPDWTRLRGFVMQSIGVDPFPADSEKMSLGELVTSTFSLNQEVKLNYSSEMYERVRNYVRQTLEERLASSEVTCL